MVTLIKTNNQIHPYIYIYSMAVMAFIKKAFQRKKTALPLSKYACLFVSLLVNHIIEAFKVHKQNIR